MAVNTVGVIVMAVFYALVLGVGIWASFKSRKEERKSTADGMERTLLANRRINWVIGVFTMSGDARVIMCAAVLHVCTEM